MWKWDVWRWDVWRWVVMGGDRGLWRCVKVGCVEMGCVEMCGDGW